jgi:hypothetical protein
MPPSDASRIAALEASARDTTAFLDELRASLSGHDSAFRDVPLSDWEQQLAPSIFGLGVVHRFQENGRSM